MIRPLGNPPTWTRFARSSTARDVLTFEHEHIPAATMEEAARIVSVQPPASALLYAQDKLAMRERLTEMGIIAPA